MNLFKVESQQSLLKNLNLNRLITKNENEYINLAIELSKNKKKLDKIKIELDNQKDTSKIFDGELYSKHLEKAYQEAYECHKNKRQFVNIK